MGPKCLNVLKNVVQVPNAAVRVIEKMSFALMHVLVTLVKDVISSLFSFREESSRLTRWNVNRYCFSDIVTIWNCFSLQTEL